VLFLLPLGFLFSAVMMAVAMYARTVKEAQNYATPIYLLSIVPAMMSTLPGFELTPFLCLVPVVGVTLLLKELLQGTIVFGHLVLVFLATSLYALAALRLTVRLFHDENVLFSSERPFALFVRRRRLKPRPLPTPGEALLLAAICFVLFFTLGQMVQAKDFRLGTAVTMWLLLFAPALWFARYLKLDLRKTFSLRAPSAAALVGTVVAVAASLVVVLEIEYVQSTLLRYPTEAVEEAERALEGLSFADLLVFAALFPALCEETLFRGFILAGLASRMRRWQAALVVGVLFGFFHIGPVAMKVIPVSHIVVGVVLSLLVAYSGSIATGVLFHLLYNGALVAFQQFSGEVTSFFERLGLGGAWLNAEGHVPAVLFVPAVALLVGALATVIGLGGSRPRV
jgi:sodium transport system permease protein